MKSEEEQRWRKHKRSLTRAWEHAGDFVHELEVRPSELPVSVNVVEDVVLSLGEQGCRSMSGGLFLTKIGFNEYELRSAHQDTRPVYEFRTVEPFDVRALRSGSDKSLQGYVAEAQMRVVSINEKHLNFGDNPQSVCVYFSGDR